MFQSRIRRQVDISNRTADGTDYMMVHYGIPVIPSRTAGVRDFHDRSILDQSVQDPIDRPNGKRGDGRPDEGENIRCRGMGGLCFPHRIENGLFLDCLSACHI